VLVLAWVVLRRRRATAGAGAPEPARPRRAQPLARPLSTGNPRDLGTMASTSGRGRDVFPFTAEPDVAVHTEEMQSPVARPISSIASREAAAAQDSGTQRSPAGARRIQGERVEYFHPSDGTLQFLPGRLEVLEGEESRHEIRFVKTPGDEVQVTFGRNEGEPYRHVQLHSRTVSRLHARMTFRDKGWLLENLSQTNPTILNGEYLNEGDAARELKDGDRIEMGEVVFRFQGK
jgi:hypothetical protein